MRLAELIDVAKVSPLREETVAASCVAEGMDPQQFYDAFARRIVDGYGSGTYSWRDADAAMNHLFSYAYSVTGEGLSDYAFLVYQAFDEGEHGSGGEAVTVALLTKLNNARL